MGGLAHGIYQDNQAGRRSTAAPRAAAYTAILLQASRCTEKKCAKSPSEGLRGRPRLPLAGCLAVCWAHVLLTFRLAQAERVET